MDRHPERVQLTDFLGASGEGLQQLNTLEWQCWRWRSKVVAGLPPLPGDAKCQLPRYTVATARRALNNTVFMLLGDSTSRRTFHAIVPYLSDPPHGPTRDQAVVQLCECQLVLLVFLVLLVAAVLTDLAVAPSDGAKQPVVDPVEVKRLTPFLSES